MPSCLSILTFQVEVVIMVTILISHRIAKTIGIRKYSLEEILDL